MNPSSPAPAPAAPRPSPKDKKDVLAEALRKNLRRRKQVVSTPKKA